MAAQPSGQSQLRGRAAGFSLALSNGCCVRMQMLCIPEQRTVFACIRAHVLQTRFHAAAAKHAAHGVTQGYQEGRQGRQELLHLQGGARRQTFSYVSVFD